MVEVGGIEPPSGTLPVCRNYDHTHIIGAEHKNLKQEENFFLLHCNAIIAPLNR